MSTEKSKSQKQARKTAKNLKAVIKPAKTLKARKKTVVPKAPSPVKHPVKLEVKAVKPEARPKEIKKKLPSGEFIGAAGKRKTAVARVRLHTNGTGVITVNERPLEQFFTLPYHQLVVRSPLKLTAKEKTFDISVKTEGGGINAQAEASRHGISKALVLTDPNLRGTLKRAGFLTRDARVKERKKYGLHRARRGPQFSKR